MKRNVRHTSDNHRTADPDGDPIGSVHVFGDGRYDVVVELQTKVCTKCGVLKPLTAFGVHPGGRLGRHPRCRECRRLQERERYRANREVILGRQRRSERCRRFASHYKRQRKYGITPEEFGALAAAQNHRCAICDRAIEPLCIDHDHHSGKIRGLLCNGCNVGIGYLGEDPARLRAAAHYVKRLTAPAGATIQTHIRRGGGVRSNAPPC
jgi:hypothetical protein